MRNLGGSDGHKFSVPAALGVAVQHHLALLNVAEPSELFLKLLLRRVETEAKDSKTLKRNNVH